MHVVHPQLAGGLAWSLSHLAIEGFGEVRSGVTPCLTVVVISLSFEQFC